MNSAAARLLGRSLGAIYSSSPAGVLRCQTRRHHGSETISRKPDLPGDDDDEQRERQTHTICVEGNIGSGKSNFLNFFADNPLVKIYKEPVDKWCNIWGHNTLDMMYKDQTRWGLTFQTYVQLTMLTSHFQKQKLPFKMMERSIYSAKYVFVENLFKSGKMLEVEYAVLTEWFRWIVENKFTEVDFIVYLKTKPEVVCDRIQKRSRPEEESIPLKYLEALHECYEDWLVRQKSFKVPAPVLVLDANGDLNDLRNTFIENKEKILNVCM